jgi:uncharacterized repeat protein (TIGR03803 family)
MRFFAVRLMLCLGTITGCAQHAISSPLPAAPSFAREVPIASGFKVLHDFTGPDGAFPYAGMVALNGVLYGTTQDGGKYSNGTVYKVSTSGAETVLHSFPDGAKDGYYPYAGLVNVNGSLYGTTLVGGEYGYGTIYKVTTSGEEHVLHAFKGGQDGSASRSGLIYVNGLLYGTTQYGGNGGCPYGCGTVFEVSPGGKERVVYKFKGGQDGENPYARLVVLNGALYGTTAVGGGTGCGSAAGCGTVFKVTTSGDEHVLHSFGGGTPDGAIPVAGLVVLDGVLYGTTAYGGTYNFGSVYKVNTSGAEHVVYSFKAKPDGARPESGLVTSGGMLYGTTYEGGTYNYGTVYEVSSSGVEHVLHGFRLGATDGADPYGGLIFLKGTLYGTTFYGGTDSAGIAFKIAP